MGLNGLILTILVFGGLSRIINNLPLTFITMTRQLAREKAMRELRRMQADRSVRNALNTRNGPDTTAILSLPLSSEVRI